MEFGWYDDSCDCSSASCGGKDAAVAVDDREREVCKAFFGDEDGLLALLVIELVVIVNADMNTDSDTITVAMTRRRRNIGDREENADIV